MTKTVIKILHVEDDETDALITQSYLNEYSQGSSFDITQVDSLKNALKELSTTEYDAVLLDLHLNDVSGMDNILAIKEQCPDLPIVVLSGVDHDATALGAIDFGAQEYLIKGHSSGKVIQLAIHSSIKRKFVERRLFKQANYDELTGLANRRLFHEHLDGAINRAKRWKRSQILFFGADT